MIYWATIQARMEELKPYLERTGFINGKKDAFPDRYVLRYYMKNSGTGKCVLKTLELGKVPWMVQNARDLLSRWREDYRRRKGGLPCRLDTQHMLMRGIPLDAGMSGRARREYRRQLRATRGDPLALLTYVVNYRKHERHLPGMKCFYEH